MFDSDHIRKIYKSVLEAFFCFIIIILALGGLSLGIWIYEETDIVWLGLLGGVVISLILALLTVLLFGFFATIIHIADCLDSINKKIGNRIIYKTGVDEIPYHKLEPVDTEQSEEVLHSDKPCDEKECKTIKPKIENHEEVEETRINAKKGLEDFYTKSREDNPIAIDRYYCRRCGSYYKVSDGDVCPNCSSKMKRVSFSV